MYIYQLLLVLNNVLHFFTYVYPWLLVLPMITLVYICLPLFTRGYTCLQLFTRSCLLHVFLCLPMFTFVTLENQPYRGIIDFEIWPCKVTAGVLGQKLLFALA